MNRYQEFEKILKNWQVPRELRHSAPRLVRLSGSGIFLVIAGAVLALGAVAAAFFLGRESTRQSEEFRRLQGNGRETDARIERLWRTSGEGRRYRVRYRFEAGGSIYTNETNVPRAKWNTLKTGAGLRVRYLPSHPETNHPSGWSKRATSIWLAVLIPGALLVLVMFMAMMLRQQRELLTEGRPAPALVTRIRKVHHSHGGSATIIHYEFPILSGAIVSGKSSSQRKGVAEGAVLCVVYDPDNPRRSSVYPLELVRVNE